MGMENMFEVNIFDIIDAGHFWARPVWHEGSEQQDFMGRLNDYFQCGPGTKASLFLPKKGQMCVIRRTSDHHWYRARVKNLLQTMRGIQASVLLVDLAEATLVPCFWIREVPPEFQLIPFQAMDCYLAGVKPLSLVTYFDGTTSAQACSHWDDTSTEYFKRLVKGCKLQMKIISEDERETSQVLLYAEKEHKQVCVNDELVKSKCAVPSEETGGQSANHKAYQRRQALVRSQQEQFQKMQHEMFKSFKESAQLETNSDSGSEELFSSQQRRDLNTHEYPLRDLSSLEYLKQQYGDERGISDSASGYCSHPAAQIPGSGSCTSHVSRAPFSQSDDFARQSFAASSSNRNIKVQLPSLSAHAGYTINSSESSVVKMPSVSARIPGTSHIQVPLSSPSSIISDPRTSDGINASLSELGPKTECHATVGSSSDHDDSANESFNRKRTTLSSDEESSGRVRFLSARLPATGKGSPGVFPVSGDTCTVNLKPILKKGVRSPKITSGSSSDQEYSPHNRNVRILDPGVANIAEMFAEQATQVSARLPGTSRVSPCAGGNNQGNENETSSFFTSSESSVAYTQQTASGKDSLLRTDPNSSQRQDRSGCSDSPLTPYESYCLSTPEGKVIGYEQQTVDSSVATITSSTETGKCQSSFSTESLVVSSGQSPRAQVQGTSSSGRSPLLPSQMLSPISSHGESEDARIRWQGGVLICGEGAPKPYDMLSNSPFTDYSSRLENIPTPIQAYAWPAVLRGRDVAAISPNNTGKTRAYLLPIVKRLQDASCYAELQMSNGPIVLILTPSWTKVQEIYSEAIDFTARLRRIRIHVAYGGGKEKEQVIHLVNGCDVLITTPACFLRLLKKRYATLDRLCHLVVDDADIMAEEFTAELKELMRYYGKLLTSHPGRVAPRQAVVFARTWTAGLASFVRAYLGNPLILIADKCEAAVFSNVKQVVNGCPSDQRDNFLLGILSEDSFRKDQDIIVFTATATEAERVLKKLEAYSMYALLATEYMEQEHLKDVKRQWNTPHATDSMPVLVMTDQVVEKLHIKNASCIVHYDFPTHKSKLGNRLACLATSERSATSKEYECRSIMFITEKHECTKWSLALVEFLRRANQEVPTFLEEEVAKTAMNVREELKKNVGLCRVLQLFGECREQRKCPMRHQLFADIDTPVDVPTSGIVKVLILEICDASCFWVRVLSHTKPDDSPCDNVKCLCDNTKFLKLTADMSLWFANAANQMKHGIPNKNDLCATKLGNSHHRVKVCEIIKRDQAAQPFKVQVLFVDLGIADVVAVDRLLKLPPKFNDVPFQAIQAFICRIQPVDKDIAWTDQAYIFVKRLIEGKEMQGRVALSIGRTMWLDPLVERAVLRGINVTTNLNNVRLELLREGKAVENKQHLKKLRALCENVIDLSSNSQGVSDVPALLDTIVLQEEGYQDVYVSAVEDPGLFYVQLSASQDSLDELRDRIDADINRIDAEDVEIDIGSLCVAQFTQDDKWYRARVQGTRPGNEYDVFYVDYGDREWITRDRIKLPWREILQLPLQAIECSLGNVVPLDNEWTSNSSDVYWEMVKDKVLVCKVTSKIGSLIAGCHKYIVELFDTSSEHDIVMSRELVIGGHAQTSPECMQVLFPEAVLSDSSENFEFVFERIPKLCLELHTTQDPTEKIKLAEEIQTIVINSSGAKDAIRENGGLKCLCRLLNVTRGPAVQEHLIVALGNLAFENESNCDDIRREGGLKALCYLLTKTQSAGVQENIAWAFKNIVMNNDRNQSEVRELGSIKTLCDLLENTTDEKVQESIAWAFVSLAKDNGRISEAIKTAGGLKTLCELVARTNNDSLLERCTWAIAELAADLRNRNLVRQYGGIEALCKKIDHLSNEQNQQAQQEFLRHAVQALKTLVNNNQHNRDVMRDLGMIATLRRLTSGTNCCWKITKRLCQDLHQRLIGWTFGGLGLSTSSPQTNGFVSPSECVSVKSGEQYLASVVENGDDEMPPLEEDDDDAMPEQSQSNVGCKLLGAEPIPATTNIYVLHPTTVWSQTKEIVRVCVRLRGVKHYEKNITEQRLQFRTLIGLKSYELDLTLFDKIDPQESKVLVKGAEVYIGLRKTDTKAWPRLVKDKAKLPYVSIDFDRWEVWSSSEDEDEEVKKKKEQKDQMYKELIVDREKRQRRKEKNRVILPEMDLSDSGGEDNSCDSDFNEFFNFS